jgi:Rieske Fe-S protein
LTPDPSRKEPLLSRRSFIGNTVKLAVAGALVPAGLAQLLPAVAPDALAGSGPGPVVLRDPLTNFKIPVTLSDLNGVTPAGEGQGVLTAEWNFLPAVVYRVPKSVLRASTEVHGYNTGQYAVEDPRDESLAMMVYDGKCKHLGCTIGWGNELGGAKPNAGREDYNDDGTPDGRILCPCHQGQYDIYNLALNQPATPPPAPLNVIEFDIKSWQDPETAQSYTDVIHGEVKVLQDGPRDADRRAATDALLDLSGPDFQVRKPGWSAEVA